MTKKERESKIKRIEEQLENKKYLVYVSDFNNKEIKTYNVYSHLGFINDLEELFLNGELARDYNKCKEEIRKSLMYHFWAKCEWEVVITDWPPHISNDELERLNKEKEEYIRSWDREPFSLSYNPSVCKKIDVYEQIMNNFDLFFADLYQTFFN
jgi:hypothetical protein